MAEAKRLFQPVAFELQASVGSASICGQTNAPRCKIGLEDVVLAVRNRYSFQTLSHLTWTWSLTCDIKEDNIFEANFSIGEGEDGPGLGQVRLRLSEHEAIRDTVDRVRCRFWINITGTLKDGEIWGGKGHIVVKEQLELGCRSYQGTEDARNKDERLGVAMPLSRGMTGLANGALRVIENKAMSTIEVSRFNAPDIMTPIAVIDTRSGALVSYLTPNGTSVLEEAHDGGSRGGTELSGGIFPNFVRAATDNDRGGIDLVSRNMMPLWVGRMMRLASCFLSEMMSHSDNWERYGLSASSPPTPICRSIEFVHGSDGEHVVVEVSCAVISHSKKELFKLSITYRIHSDHCVNVALDILPGKCISSLPSLARVGLLMIVKKDFFNITYLGRGPMENYPDRNHGSDIAFWNTIPSKNGVSYIVPSECGNRSDCTWVAFQDDSAGHGFCVVSDAVLPGFDNIGPKKITDGFNFSASLHSLQELENAEHTSDLEDKKDGAAAIHVNLDRNVLALGDFA